MALGVTEWGVSGPASGAMHLVVFGHGYSGRAVAALATATFARVTVTSRTPGTVAPPPGVDVVAFAEAGPAIATATHVVATAAPDEAGDPVLAAHGAELAAAERLVWAGYISTTGVYGDRGGGWVDEDTDVDATAPRARRRVEAEQAWARLGADRVAVDLFRTAGIYGPGRSLFPDLRAGRARRVDKPGHCFGRVHRDDIAGAVLAAALQSRPPGRRVLHLADDLPAASADVIAEAARLLGLPPPPLVAFAEAQAGMSPMARSFWADNRRVASARTQARLGRLWRYPTFRAGLRAILAEEGD